MIEKAKEILNEPAQAGSVQRGVSTLEEMKAMLKLKEHYKRNAACKLLEVKRLHSTIEAECITLQIEIEAAERPSYATGGGKMPIKLYICPECHNANETPGICCERASGSHQRVVRSQRSKDIENLRITIKVLEREDRPIELETARFFLREMKNKERQPQTPNDKVSDGCRPRAHCGTKNV